MGDKGREIEEEGRNKGRREENREWKKEEKEGSIMVPSV